jgi:hypothetical protein
MLQQAQSNELPVEQLSSLLGTDTKDPIATFQWGQETYYAHASSCGLYQPISWSPDGLPK